MEFSIHVSVQHKPCMGTCILVPHLEGFAYMRMTPKVDVIFSHNDLYRSTKFTSTGLIRLLLGVGGLKVNFPLMTLNILKFFAECPKTLMANFVFLNWTHSWLEFVDKFWEIFMGEHGFFKQKNWVFQKSGEEFKMKKKWPPFLNPRTQNYTKSWPSLKFNEW